MRIVASGFHPDGPAPIADPSDPRLVIQRKALIYQVVSVATSCGWGYFDTAASRRPTRGFADLVQWRDRVLFVTVKSTNGNLRPDEQSTLRDIADARAQVHVWPPIDLITGIVEHELRKR